MNLFDPAPLGADAVEGTATAGIRPEHVPILAQTDKPSSPDASAGHGGRKITTEATVRYCEPLGAKTPVHMVLGGGTVLTARVSAEDDVPGAGSLRTVAFDGKRMVFFDGEGRAIR